MTLICHAGDTGKNPNASLPVASSTGNLFSSDAPLDVFTRASLLGTSNAPVSPVAVPAHLCADVAISTTPATVVLALAGAVPVEIDCHCHVERL